MNVRKDAFAYSVWLVGCAALVVFAVSLPAADVKVPAGWTSETRTVKVASPDGDTDKEITYYKGRFKVPGKKNLQLEYVYIPAGKFIIGDPGEPDEQRPAEVAKGFLMSRCEVTQAQYKKVMGKNPSHFKNKPNNPVEKISWADALEFCKRLSKMEGATCRLATDEEWEYACRAGSTTEFYWGDQMRGDCGWYGRNRGGRPQGVGQKIPNEWGLYDMAGNSVEWVTGEADPEVEGSAKDGYYLRGGPVDEYDWSLKSHVRQSYADIFTGYNNLTIRVVVEVGGGGEAKTEGGSAKAGPPSGWTSRTAKVKAATPKRDMPVEVTYYQNSLTPAVLGSEVGMEFVLIEPGEFVMSSPARERGRHPDEPEQHDVTIVKKFYIGAHEVTQKQYYHIVGGGEDMEAMFADHPKEGVARGDAEEFCRQLSDKDDVTYRLPTEEEWEYACRAGSTTAYYWGKKVRDDCAWHKGNSGMRTNRVGQKLPNTWGLYDMSGNVWEWCQGPQRGSLRGGAWGGAAGLRSARRFYRLKGHNDFHGCGFRVVVDAN